MIATRTKIEQSHRKQPQVGVDCHAFASIKRHSKLLAIANEAKAAFQNAESPKIRGYLFAIYFRKLANAAEAQFELEESVGYCLQHVRNGLESPISRTAAELSAQHESMRRSLFDMAELADSQINQLSQATEDIHLLNLFWSFHLKLKRHEAAEQALISKVGETAGESRSEYSLALRQRSPASRPSAMIASANPKPKSEYQRASRSTSLSLESRRGD